MYITHFFAVKKYILIENAPQMKVQSTESTTLLVAKRFWLVCAYTGKRLAAPKEKIAQTCLHSAASARFSISKADRQKWRIPFWPLAFWQNSSLSVKVS